jgi:hypothetical protein
VESAYKRELPALVKLMNKPRLVDEGLKYLGDMSGTTYRDAFGKSEEIAFKKNDDNKEGYNNKK